MKENRDLKELVKQRYSELALNAEALKSCCCGVNPANSSKRIFTIMSENYKNLEGYEPDAKKAIQLSI